MPDESIFDDEAPGGHTGQRPKRLPPPEAFTTEEQEQIKDAVMGRIDALADTPLESTGKPPSPESARRRRRSPKL